MFLYIIHRPVFISENRPVYFSKHNVSETGFRLRPQVKLTQFGPIDRASPRKVFLDKDRTIDNAPKHNICTNVPPS
jgi:hypothetical protein